MSMWYSKVNIVITSLTVCSEMNHLLSSDVDGPVLIEPTVDLDQVSWFSIKLKRNMKTQI